MVNSEEVVERTFYINILDTALQKGFTLNPDNYLPISPENEKRFLSDIGALSKFIPIFGTGNNQVRGPKTLPRITIELQGYYPGDIGVNKHIIGDNLENGNYQNSEFPYETRDITIDVHLVAKTQSDLRLLHNIMYQSLPTRGYLKPYFNDYGEWKSESMGPSNNLFIEITNFWDHQDTQEGILEKVYTYVCKDGVIPEEKLSDGTITPIKDISVLIGLVDSDKDTVELAVN
jgi:hypothetical protein